MVMDHLLRAYGSRFCKWNFVLEPGCLHLALGIVFNMPCRSFYHKSHTVDQPDLHLHILGDADRSRLFWDEFRFCCHDCRSGRRLGQFIPRPFSRVGIRHARKYKKIHKSLDKC